LHRNSVWHLDHAPAPVEVDVDGALVRPWTICIVDAATWAILGIVITQGASERSDIRRALRAALLQTEPFGPMGGVPEVIRIDHGVLCAAVRDVLHALNVRLESLSARAPSLKNMTETIYVGMHTSLLTTLSASPPRQPVKPLTGTTVLADGPAPTFDQFAGEVLAWTTLWNTVCPRSVLGGRTPLQAWQDDDTEIVSVDPDALGVFSLAAGPVRIINTYGLTWRGRRYSAPWMNGRYGALVHIHYRPDDHRDVELYDPVSHTNRGPAPLASEPQQGDRGLDPGQAHHDRNALLRRQQATPDPVHGVDNNPGAG
jgi:putative transposase